MKNNNRGFLLAESLVVSTFVLTVLILLYIQFSNLTTNYKNSYNYNNVESIYDLSSVSSYLLDNNYNLSEQLTESKPYVIVYKDGSCNSEAGIVDSFCDSLIRKMDAKTIIYTSSDISIIKNYISSHDDSNINQKLRDFISRVETNTVLNKGRLFAEFNNDTYATIAMDNEKVSEDTTDQTPFFIEQNVSDGKMVTISFPEGCGTTLTCSYQKDDGSDINVTSKTVDIKFTSNGSLIAKVNNGIDTWSSSYSVIYESHTITVRNHEGGTIEIDNLTKGTSIRVSSGSDSTIDGSETTATLNAYSGDTIKISKLEPWDSQQIYQIKLDENKELSSNSTFKMPNSNSELLVYWQISPGTYRLESKLSQYVDLDGDTGGPNVQVWNHGGAFDDSNSWTISLVNYDYTKGRGYYKLTNKYDNDVLDVQNGETTDGTNVQTYQYNGTVAQLWDFIGAGNGYYMLQGKGSNKMLDVSNGETGNGNNVQIYQKNDTDAQKWLLVK